MFAWVSVVFLMSLCQLYAYCVYKTNVSLRVKEILVYTHMRRKKKNPKI